MDNAEPTILTYATPAPINRFACVPVSLIVFLSLVLPGISSSLIRRSPWPCLILTLSIPVAFGFFGPLWGEILFRGSIYNEAGLYPFVLTCVAVEVISVVVAIKDRRRALDRVA